MFASLPFPSPSSKRCCTHNTSRRNATRRCKHRRVSTMIADTLPGFRRCMLIRRSVRSPHLELCCLLGVPALHFCNFAAVSAFSQSSSVVLITAGSSCSSFCSILRQPSPVFVSATEHGPYRFAVTLCSVAYEDEGTRCRSDGGLPHLINTVLPVFNRAGALQISSVRGRGRRQLVHTTGTGTTCAFAASQLCLVTVWAVPDGNQEIK